MLINTIELPSDNDDPWTFSIVATTFILLLPSILGLASTVDNNSLYSNKIIALCNVLNIWSVILGTLLIGGSATYYLKLAEPLVVLFLEILMNGRNSLTSKHATNGMISVILLMSVITPSWIKSAYEELVVLLLLILAKKVKMVKMLLLTPKNLRNSLMEEPRWQTLDSHTHQLFCK